MQHAQKDDGVFGASIEQDVWEAPQLKRPNAFEKFAALTADIGKPRQEASRRFDFVNQTVGGRDLSFSQIRIGFAEIVDEPGPSKDPHSASGAPPAGVTAKHLRAILSEIPRLSRPARLGLLNEDPQGVISSSGRMVLFRLGQKTLGHKGFDSGVQGGVAHVPASRFHERRQIVRKGYGLAHGFNLAIRSEAGKDCTSSYIKVPRPLGISS